MSGYQRLGDYQKVVDFYGDWPSFHDAEVLRLSFTRDAGLGAFGPTLELDIHAFQITDEVLESGGLRLEKHALISLAFFDVVELQITDFNTQNALLGLHIDDITNRQLDGIFLDVELTPAWGLEARFQCRTGCVRSLVPGIPAASQYAE